MCLVFTPNSLTNVLEAGSHGTDLSHTRVLRLLYICMFTNTRGCLSVVILIVIKWILAQVLGINFAGTNFAYLPVLSKVFRFTFLCCFCYIVVMFVYKCSAFWLREILKS